MNVLNNITIKSLKLNKKRTLVTIIGIILSTALICAVSGLISSFQHTFIEITKKTDGDYHVTYKNVPFEETKYIENNRNVEHFFKTSDLGYAKLPKGNIPGHPYLFVKAFDKMALTHYGLELVEGRMPKNSDEIIISTPVNEEDRNYYKVGETISLKIGTRYSKLGEKLTQSMEVEDFSGETIEKTEKKDYKIVGIIEVPNNAIQPWTSAGHTAITLLDSNSQFYNISVKYHNSKKYEEYTKQINHSKKSMELGKYEIDINKELLRWEISGLGDAIMSTLIILAAIVITIIIVTSIFVIKNSFSISIIERFKQYGMLSSVGATSKQIKKNVIFEGVILGIIAIPLGILGGLLAIYILIILMNYLLADAMNNFKFVYSVSYYAILLSILLSGLTILLSSIIPAVKASRISPIEAIRSNNDIKIKAKKLKTPKIIKRIFKVEGQIALKNLKRSRKKYRTTIISIVISIVIFIALSSIINFGFKSANIYYNQLEYNIAVSDMAENLKGEVAYKKLTALAKTNDIENYSIPKFTFLSVSKEKYMNKELLYGSDPDQKEELINVVSLSEKEYDKFVKVIKGDKNDLRKKAIVIDDTLVPMDKKYKSGNMLKSKIGDKVSGTLMIGDETLKKTTIEIGARTEKRPMGFENKYGMQPLFIVSEELFQTYGKYLASVLYIQANDAKKVEESIRNRVEKNKSFYGEIYINNYDEMKKTNDSFILMISIFLYGFITVISLIGVTNIFNTVTTNMALRSKEFAMLKSIGMTESEFKRMVCLESLFYGIKSLLIGIPIGLLCSYLIYKGINQSMEMKYVIPLDSICISIVFVMMIIFATMIYSMKKINKQNIIETIRNENV